MIEVRETGCCGVLELVNISRCPTPKDVVLQAAPAMAALCNELFTSGRRPYAYFTSVTDRHVTDHVSSRKDDYGAALADYIRDNNLGPVNLAATPKLNWTGNTLHMYVWTVDWDSLVRWYESQIPASQHAPLVLPAKRF